MIKIVQHFGQLNVHKDTKLLKFFSRLRCVRIAYVKLIIYSNFLFINEMKISLGYNDTMSTYKIGHSVTC